MTVQEIRELINLVVESGIAELEVQRGENKVRVRRTSGTLNQEIVLPAGMPAQALMPAHVGASPAPPLQSSTHAGSSKNTPPPATDDGLLLVKSPIVGTFYESPSPGSAPFVKVGDTVQPGQVLCIIESMKLMNEIEAETSGVVVSKLVPNGRPVEYGEALFALRPV